MNTKPDHTDIEESTARWQWAGLILAAMFIGMFPIYRIYEPAQRADAREAQQGFLAAQGEEIYFAECSTCHGVEGRGGLGPAIGSRNFLESVGDHQISQLTALGIPGTEMVAYSIDWGGPMTSEEIEAVTAYLRSLEEDSEPYPNWQTPLVDADLDGEELYQLACSRCHGVDRTGVEDLGLDIGETSYTLDESDEWIADRINNGRNEMPRFGRVLTDEQVNMLIAYLRGAEYVAAPETTMPPTDTPTDTTAPPTDTTAAPEGPGEDVLALGQEVWDVTAGGEGCANCHGFDAKGGSGGPDVRGGSKSSIVGSIGGGTPDMEHIVLTDEELDAVYESLKSLSSS